MLKQVQCFAHHVFSFKHDIPEISQSCVKKTVHCAHAPEIQEIWEEKESE